MARIEGVPAERAGWLARLVYRAARRMYGQVPRASRGDRPPPRHHDQLGDLRAGQRVGVEAPRSGPARPGDPSRLGPDRLLVVHRLRHHAHTASRHERRPAARAGQLRRVGPLHPAGEAGDRLRGRDHRPADGGHRRTGRRAAPTPERRPTHRADLRDRAGEQPLPVQPRARHHEPGLHQRRRLPAAAINSDLRFGARRLPRPPGPAGSERLGRRRGGDPAQPGQLLRIHHHRDLLHQAAGGHVDADHTGQRQFVTARLS